MALLKHLPITCVCVPTLIIPPSPPKPIVGGPGPPSGGVLAPKAEAAEAALAAEAAAGATNSFVKTCIQNNLQKKAKSFLGSYVDQSRFFDVSLYSSFLIYWVGFGSVWHSHPICDLAVSLLWGHFFSKMC